MMETPDVELQLLSCSAYLRSMEPMARWAARRYEAPHPCLARDDLLGDAMEALCRVWRRHYDKSPGDLCRIGRVAVLGRMSEVRAHAWARGENEVAAWVDLDQPLGEDGDLEGGLCMSDILGADGIEDTFFWFGLDELERNLDEVGRLVLGELLDPGQKTLRAIRRVWRERAGKRGNWWAKYREEVVAKGIGLAREEVRGALARLRKEAVVTFLSREIPAARYRDVWGVAVDRQKLIEEKGDAMANEKGFLPDELEIGLPEPEKPAVKQAVAKKAAGASKEQKAKAPVKPRKTTTAKGPKVAKPKVGKAKATKSKVEKKAAVRSSEGPRAGSKLAEVVTLCTRKEGASKEEIVSRLRKLGSSEEKGVGYFAAIWGTPQSALNAHGLKMDQDDKGRFRVLAVSK